MDPKLKLAEEIKRNRAMKPEERWRQFYSFMAWAKKNMKPEQNRNRPRYRDAEGRVHFY
jgi:hypothetical protein